MNLRIRITSSLALLLLLACGAQHPHIAAMPPEARTTWDGCERAVTRWCADRSNNSPTAERDCVEAESQRYATQADDAARATYLRSHGCTL